MAFENGTAGLTFYKSSTQTLGHDLPCKVSCSYCRAPIMDEGRNMVLLFPTLVNFRGAEERSLWKPQYVPRVTAKHEPEPSQMFHLPWPAAMA